MAEMLIVAVCATLAWLFLFYWIPWVGKESALYGLHGLRDSLYKAARSLPDIRNTLLFRDVEHFTTLSIHMVRDGGLREALVVAPDLRRWIQAKQDQRHSEGRDSARGQSYRAQMYGVFASSAEHHRALDQILEVHEKVQRFVLLRIATIHPLMQVLVPFVLLFVAVAAPARWMQAPSQKANVMPRLGEQIGQAFEKMARHSSGRRRTV